MLEIVRQVTDVLLKKNPYLITLVEKIKKQRDKERRFIQ